MLQIRKNDFHRSAPILSTQAFKRTVHGAILFYFRAIFQAQMYFILPFVSNFDKDCRQSLNLGPSRYFKMRAPNRAIDFSNERKKSNSGGITFDLRKKMALFWWAWSAFLRK